MAEVTEFSGSAVCSTNSEHALRQKIYGVIDFLDSPVSSPQAKCKVLEGVVAFVDVRSDQDNRSEAIERQLQRLGATISPKLTNEVTHVVFKDGRKQTRERAKKWNLHLVSVLWVESCKQTQERVPESLFPVSMPGVTTTPLCVPKLKKTKSMQPKDFDVDLANSAERADKRRKRRSVANKKCESQTPSKLAFFVAETQDLSPVPARFTPNITIPDTPPSMKHLVQRLQNRHLEPSEESEEKEPLSPLGSTVNAGPLQRRLFDADNLAELSLSPGSPVRLSGGMPPPAVGESPSKATSASPRCNYSPGRAHVPKLHLQESPDDGTVEVEKRRVVPTRKDGRGETDTPKNSSSCKTPNSDETVSCQIKASNRPSSHKRSTPRRSASNGKSAGVGCSSTSVNDSEPLKEAGIWRSTATAHAVSDHTGTPGGNIKRRRSARLSCWTAGAPPDNTDVIKNRSRRRSEMPRELPLPEEQADGSEAAHGGNGGLTTSRSDKESSFPKDGRSVNYQPTTEKGKSEVKDKRNTRRNSRTHSSCQISTATVSAENRIKGSVILSESLGRESGVSCDDDNLSDLRTRVNKSLQNSLLSQSVTTTAKVVDTNKTISKSKKRSTETAREGQLKEESNSALLVSTNSINGRKTSIKSPYHPNTSHKISGKKRQSIDEFSFKNYNVSLSRKIRSQSISQQLSEKEDSSVLNMRKRSREQSLSCIASQLESTTLSKEKADCSSSRSSSICGGQLGSSRSLVMTSLHYDQQDVVESVVKKLGHFTIRDTVRSDTSHVICGKNRRTLNVLHAIAQGSWLLSYEWVLKSLEAGEWLEEAPYEVEFFPAAKKSRLMQKKSGPGCCIFEKCGTIYVSEKTIPSKSHIVKLLKKCSAQVTSDSEEADIVVGGKFPACATNVTEQWVLDSISSLQCVDFNTYRFSRRAVARSQSPQY